ncbi:unnamed protein product [Effrenium voratum]|nr:unnamed protein product [Effrenium voratum]
MVALLDSKEHRVVRTEACRLLEAAACPEPAALDALATAAAAEGDRFVRRALVDAARRHKAHGKAMEALVLLSEDGDRFIKAAAKNALAEAVNEAYPNAIVKAVMLAESDCNASYTFQTRPMDLLPPVVIVAGRNLHQRHSLAELASGAQPPAAAVLCTQQLLPGCSLEGCKSADGGASSTRASRVKAQLCESTEPDPRLPTCRELSPKARRVAQCCAITACQRATRWQEAMQHFSRCSLQSLQLDVQIAGAATRALAGWRQPVQLLKQMHNCRLSNIIVYSAAMYACARASEWQAALALLAELDTADTVCCSTAVTACEKAGLWQPALALVQSMRSCDLRLDEALLNSACSATEKGQQWLFAGQILRTMAGLKMVGVAAVSAAVSAAIFWRRALGLWQALRELGRQADVVLLNATVTAQTLWQRAVQVYATMANERLRTSVVTCNAMLAACARCWSLSLQVLQKLLHGTLEPQLTTFNSSLSCGDWPRALLLVEQLERRQLVPDDVTAGAMENALKTSWRQSLHLSVQLASSSSLHMKSALRAGEEGKQVTQTSRLLSALFNCTRQRRRSRTKVGFLPWAGYHQLAAAKRCLRLPDSVMPQYEGVLGDLREVFKARG